eukprot:gene3418-6875_t
MEGQQPAQAADGNKKFAKCRECGRKGHYARECPSLKKREPAEPAGKRSVRCFACGEVGHFARECKAQRGGGGAAQERPGAEAERAARPRQGDFPNAEVCGVAEMREGRAQVALATAEEAQRVCEDLRGRSGRRALITRRPITFEQQELPGARCAIPLQSADGSVAFVATRVLTQLGGDAEPVMLHVNVPEAQRAPLQLSATELCVQIADADAGRRFPQGRRWEADAREEVRKWLGEHGGPAAVLEVGRATLLSPVAGLRVAQVMVRVRNAAVLALLRAA